MLKAIIFDLDGTLIDSVNFWLSLYKKTAKKLNIKLDEKEVSKRFGEKDVDILISLTPKEKREEAISYFYMLKEREKKRLNLKKFKFVDSVLKKIKEKKIKIGITTGNSKDIAEYIVKKNKLEKYIDYLVTHEDVKRGKPYPDMILKIIKHFKVKKKDVLCVGDSLYDFKAAKRAKVKIGLVLTGVSDKEDVEKLKPNFVFKDIRDVLKLLN
jgi:HAD superfamily hydrolase (TIGR01549 family)